MQIRTVQTSDYPAVYDLVKIAFQTAKVSDGTEQDFVNALRARPSYLPELELAAENEEGALTGHIMMTKTTLITDGGEALPALMVAPLSVRLENRSCGLGARLMEEGLRRARELGYTCAFLVGDPAYYSRFGFRPVTAYGLRNETHAEDCYVLGCPIIPDVLDNASGGVCLE